jgi:hypothetical protein
MGVHSRLHHAPAACFPTASKPFPSRHRTTVPFPPLSKPASASPLEIAPFPPSPPDLAWHIGSPTGDRALPLPHRGMAHPQTHQRPRPSPLDPAWLIHCAHRLTHRRPRPSPCPGSGSAHLLPHRRPRHSPHRPASIHHCCPHASAYPPETPQRATMEGASQSPHPTASPLASRPTRIRA